MGPYIIDFEAFQHGDEQFKIKELCVLDVDRPLAPLYVLYEADRSWDSLTSSEQKTYSYQRRHVHHLGWEEGDRRYCPVCLMHYIMVDFPQCRNSIFYVMGEQKLKFLQQQLPKLNFCEYNIVFEQLPPIAHNISCFHRNHGEHCACLKCYRLYTHYITLPM